MLSMSEERYFRDRVDPGSTLIFKLVYKFGYLPFCLQDTIICRKQAEIDLIDDCVRWLKLNIIFFSSQESISSRRWHYLFCLRNLIQFHPPANKLSTYVVDISEYFEKVINLFGIANAILTVLLIIYRFTKLDCTLFTFVPNHEIVFLSEVHRSYRSHMEPIAFGDELTQFVDHILFLVWFCCPCLCSF